jgi:hypothetical protein
MMLASQTVSTGFLLGYSRLKEEAIREDLRHLSQIL